MELQEKAQVVYQGNHSGYFFFFIRYFKSVFPPFPSFLSFTILFLHSFSISFLSFPFPSFRLCFPPHLMYFLLLSLPPYLSLHLVSSLRLSSFIPSLLSLLSIG